MVFIKVLRFVICMALCTIIICSGNENKESDEFIPTDEWQVVQKGQKIPKGLHIRVNFETGVTEAKLLDKEEKAKDNRALLEVPQDYDDNKLLETKVIKEALKKIKGDDILKPDEIKKIKDKFRSYEKLKEEMVSLNLTPKIDAEVLKDLFKQHKEEINKQKINVYAISRILEDLDFLAHQFDNALEFVNQNGFSEIIYTNLNLSSNRIKEDTLKLFGALVQNNARVQIHALETGSVGILLRILNTESSTQIRSRALFALSCLLRRFPLAQLRFAENGGLSVMSRIFEKGPLKVQIKLVTLMNDLLMENMQALKDKENTNRKAEQYKIVNLENLLLDQNWCENLNKLLLSIIAIDSEDHDSIEKCVLAMHTVAAKCAVRFNKDILVGLQHRYKALAQIDLNLNDEFSNTDFFNNVHELCGDILKFQTVKTEL